MTKPPPIYAPISAKERNGNFGPILKLSFQADNMIAFIQEHRNAKGYVNLEVTQRKSEGKYGESHNVKLDTWQPTQGFQDMRGAADAPGPVDAGRNAATEDASDEPPF